MAITLSDQTIAFYEQMEQNLKGLDRLMVSATAHRPIYESQLTRPTLLLKGAGTAADTTLHVENAHLYPKAGTVFLVDTSNWNQEFVNYRRVVNDQPTSSNAAPSFSGAGNAPGGFLLLDSALANPYTIAGTIVYIADKALSGQFPHESASYASAQDVAAWLELLKPQLEHSAATLTATGGSTTTVQDTGAFTNAGVNSQVGNKVTIVTTTDSPNAPEGEWRYIVSNDNDTLTVFPAFTAQVDSGDTYSISVEFFDDEIAALQEQLPHGKDESDNVQNGPARNLLKGATIAAQACMKIIVQLGGDAGVFNGRVDCNTDRKQIAQWLQPYTVLTRPHAIGETELWVDNPDMLPRPTGGDTKTIVTVEADTTVTSLTMTRNNRRSNGSGENSVTLSTGLVAAIDSLPCYVYWEESTAELKAEQFLNGNPRLSKQAELGGGIGMLEYLALVRSTVEASTIPA